MERVWVLLPPLHVAVSKKLYSQLFPSLCVFQIVFEATRGSSVRSDIAIDDIILESGPCQGKQSYC